jgi:hypothetical protein
MQLSFRGGEEVRPNDEVVCISMAQCLTLCVLGGYFGLWCSQCVLYESQHVSTKYPICSLSCSQYEHTLSHILDLLL